MMDPLGKFKAGPGQLSCHQVAKNVQAYLDGEADRDISGRIALHLEDCVRCGLDARVYQRIKESLAGQAPSLDREAEARLRRFAEDLTAGRAD